MEQQNMKKFESRARVLYLRLISMCFNNPDKVLYINGDEQLINRHRHRHIDYKEHRKRMNKREGERERNCSFIQKCF